jgi:hypothetical protein
MLLRGRGAATMGSVPRWCVCGGCRVEVWGGCRGVSCRHTHTHLSGHSQIISSNDGGHWPGTRGRGLHAHTTSQRGLHAHTTSQRGLHLKHTTPHVPLLRSHRLMPQKSQSLCKTHAHNTHTCTQPMPVHKQPVHAHSQPKHVHAHSQPCARTPHNPCTYIFRSLDAFARATARTRFSGGLLGPFDSCRGNV